MKPTRALYEKMCQLFVVQAALQTDTDSPLWIKLITAPFTPSLDLQFADLQLDGNRKDVSGVEDSRQFTDADAGEYVGSMYGYSEGHNYFGTDMLIWYPGGITTPRTFYGYALFEPGESTLLAVGVFTPPKHVTKNGDAIRIPWVEFRFPENIIR